MYDMTIQLQTNSERCLYEQIYDYIRQEIREGKLLAGEKLPSTRSLSEYLQVARSTVDYAYGQLLSEGYIESKPCRGYFVCPMEELFLLEEQRGAQIFRAGNGVQDGKDGKGKEQKESRGKDGGGLNEKGSIAGRIYAGRTDSGEIETGAAKQMGGKQQTTGFCYDFSPNAIDMTSFPFGVWKRITKNILTDGNSELFSQGEPQGDFDLRLTISRYLHSSRGVNCFPEQIIVGAGNDYLLMLLEKILGRHVHIAMEDPTYKRAYHIFRSFAYEITTVDMDECGMKVSELRKTDVRVAYVMPSHQYPTGIVMPIGRRTELLKWANESPDRFLIEDDYDSEFRYRGKPIPSLQASDEQGKVIYMGTFSKSIAPAIRVSYMVLPEILLSRYRKDCLFYSCTVSRIDQRILNEFIRDGYFERHLNKMRKCYRDKHDLLLEGLRPFTGKFEVSGEHAGLHLLLTTRGKETEEELIRAAADGGVKVYGLSEAMVENSGRRPTILLGFGGLGNDEIVSGVKRLEKAWM